MPEGTIALDDPRAVDVRALLARHVAFADANCPPEDVHALDVSGLLAPEISFFSYRLDGDLLGIGALKMHHEHFAEVKSMHTAEEARGRGIGRTMVCHLLDVARGRGVQRVSLETGTMAVFTPARALYASVGFEPCPPFAQYFDSPNSICMTLLLER